MNLDIHGLREDDLSPEERRRRDRELEHSEEARDEAAFAETLTEALGDWPEAAPPDFEAVLARVEATPVEPDRSWRSRGAAIGLVLLAATALLFLLPGEEPGWRSRGVGGSTADLAVEVAVDGVPPRPLAPGEPLPEGARAILRVHTSAAGFLTIEGARGARVFPADGAWAVGPGRHVPMSNGTVLGYAPDDGRGSETLVVRWCPAEEPDARCESRPVRLVWK